MGPRSRISCSIVWRNVVKGCESRNAGATSYFCPTPGVAAVGPASFFRSPEIREKARSSTGAASAAGASCAHRNDPDNIAMITTVAALSR